ncbi:MAG TPA: adenylate cyclase regulatory domain-containing protein [Solirubrobacteraceae bacterium]|nr:adenylate cyclase regulatory domain-containing protein [Solirubrobacteraceae bacterium]
MSAGDPVDGAGELTLERVAAGAGVSPGTVRRWVDRGLVPGYDGRWTLAAAAYVRVVARLRARGHSLEQIKQASDAGQLAIGPIESLLRRTEGRYTLRQVSRSTGLQAAMIQRILAALGLASLVAEPMNDEDVEMLRYVATMLDVGLPPVAFLQLARVYAQALGQIADAEVRLVHLYVHEPLMRAGIPSAEIGEEMEEMVRELIPFVVPLLGYVHDRLLSHFIEQDLIGHVEAELGDGHGEDGRLRVAIAFADLAGYARLTVERGDEEAVRTVERFVEAAGQSLPADARVIKTLGDEVMVIGTDPAALAGWAVRLQSDIVPGEPAPRIGIHYGEVLYRDGDYYGREVNQAARVVARAAGGEVLATRPVVDVAMGTDGLEFHRIGEVALKGFSDATELFTVARPGE